MVYNVDPTSPSRQSQQPHFRQSSCQYKSKAFNRKRSVIRFPQPAQSRDPLVGPVFGAADTAAAVTTPVGEFGIVDAVDVLWPIVTTPRLAAIEFGVVEC